MVKVRSSQSPRRRVQHIGHRPNMLPQHQPRGRCQRLPATGRRPPVQCRRGSTARRARDGVRAEQAVHLDLDGVPGRAPRGAGRWIHPLRAQRGGDCPRQMRCRCRHQLRAALLPRRQTRLYVCKAVHRAGRHTRGRRRERLAHALRGPNILRHYQIRPNRVLHGHVTQRCQALPRKGWALVHDCGAPCD